MRQDRRGDKRGADETRRAKRSAAQWREEKKVGKQVDATGGGLESEPRCVCRTERGEEIHQRVSGVL